VRLFALCQDEARDLEALQETVGHGVTLLVDPAGEAIDSFGMRDPDPVPPRPMARAGTFLIDRDGNVRRRWLSGRYHERPDPERILAALR
jgi:peroxiredoxin